MALSSDQFTPEQVKEYFDNCGNCCPGCGSDMIKGGHFNSDGVLAWQDITCDVCEIEWRDLYKLVEIDKI